MKIVATQELANVTGSIVYWTVRGAVPTRQLRDSWSDGGLNEDLLPPLPTPVSAMGRVMSAITTDKRITRPVPGSPGSHMVLVHRMHNGQPSFVTKYIVAAPSDIKDEPTVIDAETFVPPTDAAGVEMEREIKDQFNFFKLHYTSSDQTSWMVALAKRVGATTLRPTGGMYFVHAAKLHEWEPYVRAFETACNGEVFSIPAMPVRGVFKAVMEAVTNETAAFVQDIDEKIVKGGMRSLESRKREIASFEAKISMYADLIGDAQTALMEKLEKLRTRVDAAMVQTFETL